MSSTNGTAPKGATILSLEVHDFQGLKAAKLENLPGQGLVKVTGPNGAGKSTILRAIQGALGGKAQVHERSIRDGAEDGATIAVELSNGFRIRRSHTEANPKGHLVVTGPDGGKHAQAKLNELLGPLSFDPQAFFGLDAKRQREVLLSIGHDKDLAGKLDTLRAERARLYAERTPWIARQRDARKTAKPDGDRPEPVDTTAAMAELRQLQAEEREHADAARAVAEEFAEVQRLDAAIANQHDEIERLRSLLAEATAKLEDIVADRRQAALSHAATVEAFEARQDPATAIQACMERIDGAEAVQRALRPWEAWDAAQVLYQESTDRVAELTRQMDEKEAQEHRLIAEAGIPVPGLSFDSDGVPLLDGRPLELASGGQRIELAVQVALAADPTLRVALVDEANDLDLEAMDRLRRMAEEHGFQIWIARIGLEGPGDVSVLDGVAATRKAAVEAEA